jgi:hypothetical protein
VVKIPPIEVTKVAIFVTEIQKWGGGQLVRLDKEQSVSHFQEKEKRGEMITKNDNINDNINDNTHPLQGKMIKQK